MIFDLQKHFNPKVHWYFLDFAELHKFAINKVKLGEKTTFAGSYIIV